MIKVKITIDHNRVTVGDVVSLVACSAYLLDFKELVGEADEVNVLKCPPPNNKYLKLIWRVNSFDLDFYPLAYDDTTVFADYSYDKDIYEFLIGKGFTKEQLESGVYIVPA